MIFRYLVEAEGNGGRAFVEILPRSAEEVQQLHLFVNQYGEPGHEWTGGPLWLEVVGRPTGTEPAVVLTASPKPAPVAATASEAGSPTSGQPGAENPPAGSEGVPGPGPGSAGP